MHQRGNSDYNKSRDRAGRVQERVKSIPGKRYGTQTQVGGHQHLSGSMNKIKQTDPHAGTGEMFF